MEKKTDRVSDWFNFVSPRPGTSRYKCLHPGFPYRSLENLGPLFRAIDDIRNVQTSFSLLRTWASAVKSFYLFRLITTRLSVPIAKRFDVIFVECLRHLAGGVLPATCIEELRLPINFTKPSFNIGLNAAADVAAPCFLGSVNLVRPIFFLVLPPNAPSVTEIPTL